ncbi:MAG TPA: response regulator [Planctomycetota bacterium]|nr:response regulator [Planctomycetota bacterium]
MGQVASKIGRGTPRTVGPVAEDPTLRQMSHRILVVEDEPDLLEAVVFALRKEGMKPIPCKDGEEALRIVKERRPDLVLLDLMLPGLDGIEVCRRLRASEDTARIPIIMITAKAEETDAVIGLGVGADDYVRKPFGLKELAARVRSLLRRTNEPPEPGQPIRHGELEVDPSRHEVRLHGKPIPVTATEFRLLVHLARNPGRVYSRAQLLDKAVGTDVIVIERNIDVHISALRRKLEDYGDRLVTIRGVGYKFVE